MPTPRSSPGRRTSASRVARLALPLVAVAACGGPPPEPVVRLLDVARDPARSTTMETGAAPETGSELLFDGSGATWAPIARMDQEADEAELATFLEHARVEPGGVLRLAAVRGAWVALVPEVPPRSVVELSAQVRVDGLSAGGVGRRAARLLLVELREVPAGFELAEIHRTEVARTWGPSVLGDGVERDTSAVARTSDQTRAALVFCFLNLLPADDDARVAWSDVRLVRRSPRALLGAACEDPFLEVDPERVTVAPFSIAEVQRPAIALLPGDGAALRVALPASGGRLETWLGLVPYAFAPPGGSARLSIDVGAGAGRTTLVELELENLPAAAARWHPVDVPLPEALAGREVELALRVTSSGDTPLVGAFATPQLVPRDVARRGRNVVLVSLDTLRADRVGCYGAPRDTTPAIDALASESLLFEEAWSTAPYTLPSHVSLLSGQLPGVHGAERPGSRIDPVRTRLLAELLHEREWATGAFTGGGFVHPDFGFARGFERYGTIDPVVNLDSSKVRAALERIEGRDLELVAEAGVDSVVDWIERHADRSFFLFLHSYAPHEFDPSERALEALGIRPPDPDADAGAVRRLYDHTEPTDAERERLLELYDGSVRDADRALGRVLDALRRLGLWEDTIVVVTSDHGKELGEHGSVNHGHSLHRELLRVPLVVRVPGSAPRRVATPVSAVDVLPTLLDALDLPLPPGVQGTSLLAGPAARPLFAEVDNLANQLALRRGDLKTIVSLTTNEPERWEDGARATTYDLAADPLETEPLPPGPEDLAEVLETGRSLRALRRALGGTGREPQALDPATRAQLEDLGYTIHEND